MHHTNNSIKAKPELPLPGVRIVLLSILATCSPLSLAQNNEELRNLVFEPVLIETTAVDEEVIVREITSLPSSDNPMSTSEYLVTNAINAQEEIVTNPESAIEDYEAAIRDLELEGGAYEPALSQELVSLGTLYQSLDDHEKALEYFDQALHINRVNLGLFNLDQEAIIENIINSHVALGDLQAADTQQEYLFFLKRRAYGSTSIDLLPALTRYAEWNIFAFDSRLAMDPASSYAASSSLYSSNGVNNSIGDENFKTVRLVNAQNIYRTIIQILLNNFGASDPRLLEIEKRLALTNYFFATNLDVSGTSFNGNNSSLTLASSQGYYDMSRVSSNSMGYRHGREALERRLEYMLEIDGTTAQEIAQARVELGDWLLLFKKRQAALQTYEEAYHEAVAAGVSEEVMTALFSPVLPATIPTFIDYRYTRAALGIPDNQPLDYQGWLDIRIRINRFGQPMDVDILGKSTTTTESIESRLVRLLRNSTSFRPRFKNAELVDEDIIEARYFYSY